MPLTQEYIGQESKADDLRSLEVPRRSYQASRIQLRFNHNRSGTTGAKTCGYACGNDFQKGFRSRVGIDVGVW